MEEDKPSKEESPTQLERIVKKYSSTIIDIKTAILAIYSEKSNDAQMIENFSLSYDSMKSEEDMAKFCNLRLKKDYDYDMSVDAILELAKQLPDAVKDKEKEDFSDDIVKKVEQEEILKKTKGKSFSKGMKKLAYQLHPNQQAQMLYEENAYFYDKAKIFWAWDDELKKYDIIDETDIMIAFDTYIAQDGINTNTSSFKSQILEAIRKFGRKMIPKNLGKTKVQFKDKIIDVITDEVIDATHEYFCANPIPQEIGETDETPNMDRIFKDWVGEKYVKTLYEIIAYCCVQDYPIHRLFCLVGSGLNGKGKYQELICRFIGLYNICSTDLDLLTKSRFEMFKLYKKLVCQIGETEFHELTNTGMLKKLSGQDVIGFEKKGKDGFDDYNYAKIIINSNQLPTTTDKTKGFYRRWLIIDFPNEFDEKKDILDEIPEDEYKCLAKKTINVLKELIIKRAFTNEGTIEERMQKYEDKSNPLDKFMKEKIEESPDEYIFKYEFKNRFESWCKQNAYRVWNDTELGTELKKRYEEKQRGEKKYRAWVGIAWKSQGSQGSQGSLISLLHGKSSRDGCEPCEVCDSAQISPHNTILEYIKGNPKNNAVYLDEKFPEEIQKMKVRGDIYESESGTYKIM